MPGSLTSLYYSLEIILSHLSVEIKPATRARACSGCHHGNRRGAVRYTAAVHQSDEAARTDVGADVDPGCVCIVYLKIAIVVITAVTVCINQHVIDVRAHSLAGKCTRKRVGGSAVFHKHVLNHQVPDRIGFP